ASREVALPRLGLGVASHGAPLTPAEVERLRALALDHLRVDLHFGADDVNAKLAQAATEARALGASLHVALHLSDDAASDLAALRETVSALAAPVSVWLVFRQGEKSTGARWVQQVRDALQQATPEAWFAGGTDA